MLVRYKATSVVDVDAIKEALVAPDPGEVDIAGSRDGRTSEKIVVLENRNNALMMGLLVLCLVLFVAAAIIITCCCCPCKI